MSRPVRAARRSGAIAVLLASSLAIGVSCADAGDPGMPTPGPAGPAGPAGPGGLDPSGPWGTIVASDGYSCGIAKSGPTYCWGVNDRGQLGDGTRTPRTVPTPVMGGHRFVSLAAQRYTTCAISDATQAFCWGFHNDALDVPTLVSDRLHFKALAVGDYEVCGLGTDGVPYCWTTIRGGPATPTPPDAALRLTGISGTDYQFCGATTSGAVACWEGNEYTNSAPTTQTVPGLAVTVVATGGPWATIGPRDAHACAAGADGSVFCWGDNASGQLGDGTSTARAAPVAVVGGRRFRTIVAAYRRTCGIGTDSLAYCWGYAPGSGNQPQPTAAHPQLRFAQLSVSESHTCGVTPSGAGYCWGANGAGQLGTGRSEGTFAVPVRVLDPP